MVKKNIQICAFMHHPESILIGKIEYIIVRVQIRKAKKKQKITFSTVANVFCNLAHSSFARFFHHP